MLKTDEDALICDLAETYGIYEYRQLPASRVAVFSAGLRDNSRIMLAMTGQRLSFEQMMLAGMQDRLSLLLWSKTKDGQRGVNPPQSVLETLLSTPRERQELVFASGEEFMRAREAILKREG